MGLSQFDERQPFVNVGQIAAADSPGIQNIGSAGSAFLRIDTIIATTDDTDPVEIQLAIDDSFGDIAVLAGVTLAPGAGTLDGVPAVDLLAAAGLGDKGIVLFGPASLRFTTSTTLNSGKYLWCVALGGYC